MRTYPKNRFNYIMFMVYLILILTGICAFINSGFSQVQFIYDAKNKRDPFMPLIDKEGRFLSLDKQSTEAKYELEGIIYDPKGVSLAIINGAILEISDTINDYKLVTIEEFKVILDNGSQTLSLDLKKEE